MDLYILSLCILPTLAGMLIGFCVGVMCFMGFYTYKPIICTTVLGGFLMGFYQYQHILHQM